jgi:hypothetical protein
VDLFDILLEPLSYDFMVRHRHHGACGDCVRSP